MLIISIFSFSHNVSNPIKDKNIILANSICCRLQMLQIWTSLQFVVCQRDNQTTKVIVVSIFSFTYSVFQAIKYRNRHFWNF